MNKEQPRDMDGDYIYGLHPDEKISGINHDEKPSIFNWLNRNVQKCKIRRSNKCKSQ